MFGFFFLPTPRSRRPTLFPYTTLFRSNLHFGANAKIIRRIIGKFADSWGFGFDLGVQYKLQDWQFGLMARDITTDRKSTRLNSSHVAMSYAGCCWRKK